MSEIRIDKKKAKSLLFGAVKFRGRDYVYPRHQSNDGCVYAHKGEPDCMVGQALADAGVEISTLKALNACGAITRRDAKNLLEKNGVILTDGAYDVFERAQFKQDTGRPWGEAYDVAKGA